MHRYDHEFPTEVKDIEHSFVKNTDSSASNYNANLRNSLKVSTQNKFTGKAYAKQKLYETTIVIGVIYVGNE